MKTKSKKILYSSILVFILFAIYLFLGPLFPYSPVKFGYKIIEAQNGKNALQLTKQKDIHIDLVITDLIMPEMNGQELANKITEFLPDLKIIFVSGYTFEHLIKDGEVEESINFLQKPYTIQNILRKIRETLDN